MRTARLGILLASAAFAASPALAEKIFVSNEKGNTVTVLDGETHEVVHTIEGMQRPRGITASPDGRHIYVCASDDNLVRVYDAATYEELPSLPSGAGPGALRAASVRQPALHRQRGRQHRHRGRRGDAAGAGRGAGRRRARGHGREPGRQDRGQHLRNHEHGAPDRHRDLRDRRERARGQPAALRRVHAGRLEALRLGRDRRHGERDRHRRQRDRRARSPSRCRASCRRRCSRSASG